jgi:HEPN domain-containing protein
MKDEALKWIQFADENLNAARILLQNMLLNACLQNIQQSVEKYLKAALICLDKPFKKTHSIRELMLLLAKSGTSVEITDDEQDFLDSIYLPSKYPLGSALPDFYPDIAICRQALEIAVRVQLQTKSLLETHSR